MVEYFGEHLDGFVFTQNGWVQSYGSRCAKPPIVIGDISPPGTDYRGVGEVCAIADRQTGERDVLTGPVTIRSTGADATQKVIASLSRRPP
ncbi:hypothetical protein ACNKHX_23820 [Shigella flexneri]